MNILVINCGSSSLKYQLIDSESEKVLAKGLCERIGIDNSAITHQPDGGEKRTEQIDMPDHTAGKNSLLLSLLPTKYCGRWRNAMIWRLCIIRRIWWASVPAKK